MRMENGAILDHRRLTEDYRLLTVECPEVSSRVRPGQFVHVRIPGAPMLSLRRPFTVYKADGRGLTVLYKVVGEGTALLQRLTPGTRMSVLGPLGNGFPSPAADRTPVLVAGGFGVAALYMLANASPARGSLFAGARTARDLLGLMDFVEMGWNVEVATDDGSSGFHGTVTALLESRVQVADALKNPVFYACGPNPMLRAVGEVAIRIGSQAWLSMDRHMGCGVGACLACVQRIRRDDGAWEWKRVCREGPVFECRQIDWGS